MSRETHRPIKVRSGDWLRITHSRSGIQAVDRIRGHTVRVIEQGVDSDGCAYLRLELRGAQILAYDDQLEYETALAYLGFTDPS